MDARELAPGLWRWTAPHPAWAPGAAPGSTGDWGELVGCLLYQSAGGAVFIDPLLPPDSDSFWEWADRLVSDGPAYVLMTLAPHRRSAKLVADRYGASTSRARRKLPPDVRPIPLAGARETMFWLPSLRALVPGDRLLGAPGGGLMMCPESWLYWVDVDQQGLRALLAPLLDLPIESVVVSHGDPVMSGGVDALRRCLER